MTGRAGVATTPGLDPASPASPREIAALATRILDALGLPDARVSLLLVTDARMATVNRDFMHRIGPTNILSFPDHDPEDPGHIGQAVLSIDTLLREAELYGQNPTTHLVRLLAHAFLHLAGHHHGPTMDHLTETAVNAVIANG